MNAQSNANERSAPRALAVDRPPHYAPAHGGAGGIECVDAMRAMLGDEAFVAHCRATALKYVWRAGRKGDACEDLAKAEWYLGRARDVLGEVRERRAAALDALANLGQREEWPEARG